MTTEGLSVPWGSVGSAAPPATDRQHRSAHPVSAWLARRPTIGSLALDVTAIALAALDVWLVIPQKAQGYSIVLSAVACLGLAGRRWFPFVVVLVAVPGFLAGWAQLAAMIALGMLATRKQLHWHTLVGAGLVWLCRFVEWPLNEFVQHSWREHLLNGIYGLLVAGMPVALGLLIWARGELAARFADLAASRDRERQLHAQAVRAEERARLAREMHDVVSHDIALVTMQAGALQACAENPDAQQTARTIRQLSNRTLEQLRSMVGVLRAGLDAEGPHSGIGELDQLVRECGLPVELTVERVPDQLPTQVSAAVYRTVQECLTNVHKHAPGARASVRIAGEQGALRVQVRNERSCEHNPRLPSGGHGLTGLAERARLLGGSLDTAVTDDGGFQVHARYPIQHPS